MIEYLWVKIINSKSCFSFIGYISKFKKLFVRLKLCRLIMIRYFDYLNLV